MEILRPPVDQIERSTAYAAAAAARAKHQHVGIRPTKTGQHKRSPGARVAPGRTNASGNVDDAIERARDVWPRATNMTVFGADDFEGGPLFADNYDDNWFEDAEDGSGAADAGGCGTFSGCTDYGTFDIPPAVNIAPENC